MKKLDWKEVAELLGLAAIVASLFFVGQQLRLTHEIALAEMNWVNMTAEMQARSPIYDHPEVWAKGNTGEPLSSSEAVIYETLIRDWNSLHFYRYFNLIELVDEREGGVIIADMAGFLHENPGARKEWDALRAKFRRWRSTQEAVYSSRFEEAVRKALAKLDETRDSKPADP